MRGTVVSREFWGSTAAQRDSFRTLTLTVNLVFDQALYISQPAWSCDAVEDLETAAPTPGANVKELQLRTGCHIHVDDVAIGGPDGRIDGVH